MIIGPVHPLGTRARVLFRHPHICRGEETEFLLQAFCRDFEANGPSIVRISRTTLAGWKRYRTHPDGRIRERFAREAADLPTAYAGIVWAARRRLRANTRVAEMLTSHLRELKETFGWKTRIAAPLLGRIIQAFLAREEKRLSRGWTYEPATWYEKNVAARAQEGMRARFRSRAIRWVSP